MTRTINIEDISSIQVVIEMTKNGDDIVVEQNGEALVRVSPMEKRREIKQRTAGLGEGKGYFMSKDFDDELPDEFWGFNKEL